MRSIIIAATATVTVTLFSSPAFTQQPTRLIPDFSGLWTDPYWPGFDLPTSGPGPVVNKSRMRQRFDADGRPLLAANARS